MAVVVVSWRDITGLQRFDNMLAMLEGRQSDLVQVRALNRVGDMAKTIVVRTLTRQTGLQRKVIVKAIGKPKRASFGDKQYVMSTSGGPIAVKYFRPRETRAGVTAYPRGERTLFASAFMKGGRFPNRVPVAKFNGHVFEREGASRLPISKVRTNVTIPGEMVTGATADAFEQTVAINLPRRIEHELSRLTKGVLS